MENDWNILKCKEEDPCQVCFPREAVEVWLHEQADLRIEGRILGFDEFLVM